MMLRRAIERVRERFARPERRLLFAVAGINGVWPAMGRELFRRNAVFRASIEACDAVVRDVLGCSTLPYFADGVEDKTSRETHRRDKLLRFGLVQLAQIDLWRDAGIEPGGVLTISMGEMAGPYAAHAMSRDDSARVIAAIAHGISRTRSAERMFLIDADLGSARVLCREAPALLHVATTPTPNATLLLASESDAATIRDYLGNRITREIRSDWPYHTPRLDIDRQFVFDQLRDVRSQPPRCPIYSAAAGGETAGPFDAAFFLWMVSRESYIAEATAGAVADEYEVCVNIGGNPANVHDSLRTTAALHRDIQLVETTHAGDELRAWRKASSQLRAMRLAPPVAKRTPFDEDEALRAIGPVVHIAQDNHYVILGYDEVRQALAETQTFSSAVPVMQSVDPHLLGNDPPAHTSVRRAIQQQLSLTDAAASIEATAARLLQPLVNGDELDVVRDFADPLAFAVAAAAIGVPPEMVERFAEPVRAARGQTSVVHDNLHDVFDEVATHSRSYAALREPLGDDAARGVVRMVWIAGITTRRVLAFAVLLLLEHPHLREQLQRDATLLPAYIEEVLRVRPPEHVVPRITTRAVTLGGVAIPERAIVHLSLAAANRDPARFPEPATIRLDRGAPAHVTFGGGAHHCIGAPLARATLVTAMRALLDVAPDFVARQPLATIRFAPHAAWRELEQLVIAR